MKQPDFDPLLNDLLDDARYGEFRADLKQRTLAEFRRQRQLRRIRSRTALIIVGCLLGVGIWNWKRPWPDASVAGTVMPPPSVPAIAAPGILQDSNSLPTISDDGLLALFPPGSCFLAELDGKLTLVFHDSNLRDEVMR